MVPMINDIVFFSSGGTPPSVFCHCCSRSVRGYDAWIIKQDKIWQLSKLHTASICFLLVQQVFHSNYNMIRFLAGHKVVELTVVPEISPGFSHLKVVLVVSIWWLMWIRLTVTVQATLVAKCLQQRNEGLEGHWIWDVLCQGFGCRSSWAGSEQAWKLPVLLSLPAGSCIAPVLLIMDCGLMGAKRPCLTARSSPRGCLGRGRHGGRDPLDTVFLVSLFRTHQRDRVLQAMSTRCGTPALGRLGIFLVLLYPWVFHEENANMSTLVFYGPNLRASKRPS